jgi:hypothetical protein
MIRPLATALLCLAAIPLLTSGGKKSESFVITFHVEAPAEEAPDFAAPIKLGTEMRQYYFKKVPEVTDRDIAWFYPFVSENGQSFGAAFKLKDKAMDGLKALSLTHQGKLLGARIANAPYSAVMIDRPIEDGVLVVWNGLDKTHLKAFEKKFPHVENSSGAAPKPNLPNVFPAFKPD